jgi:beta-galactosidase
VVGVGRRAGRALLPVLDSLDAPTQAADPYRLDLGGQWAFEWVQGLRGFDVDRAAQRGPQGDGRLTVPGVWQLQGYGVPQYLANRFPPALRTRRGRIPDIDPDLNEAGLYGRWFVLPAGWRGRRVSLVLEGVKAGAVVVLNGVSIGLTKGSFSPAEFDVTDALRPGQNYLSIVVLRYTDGSYLEGQDMWYASGIVRQVYLRSEPSVALHDVVVRGDLDDDYRLGLLRTRVTVSNATDVRADVQVRLLLGSPRDAQLRPVDGDLLAVEPGRQAVCELGATVPDVLTWSAETPHLYPVGVELLHDGVPVQAARLRTGFRRVEILDGIFCINGRPVVLLGVNRHDVDPDHLWAVPEHRYRHDLVLAKRLNVNAIRCSHYPNPSLLYDLCDELGLYVMDECDLESHGVRRKNVPGDNPLWQAAAVDRMERMVLAHRNHPSIVMWSLGNEAGLGGSHGGAFVRMKQAALALDDSRPFHYEGDHHPAISDVVSRMYATAEQVATLGRGEPLTFGLGARVRNLVLTDDKDVTRELLAGRPVLQCEYAHAMQNSLGNFAEHVEVFFDHPTVAGGFVWDFVDQAIRRVDEQGTVRWLYGGDFGDTPHHGTVLINGVLAADRTPHPSAFELRWGYRPVTVEALDPARGRYRVTNRYAFLDTSHLHPVVQVRVDGRLVRELTPPAPVVPPGESREWSLAGAVPPADTDAEVVVRVGWHLDRATVWADAGFEVAADEVVLPRRRPPSPSTASAVGRRGSLGAATAEVGRTEASVVLAGGDSLVEVDVRTGELRRWQHRGVEVLAAPLRPVYWRAPTDNERGLANVVPRLERTNPDRLWRHPGLGVADVREGVDPDGAVVTLTLVSPLLRATSLQYRVRPDGSLEVDHRLEPRRPMVRVGLTSQVRGIERVRWYGKGPHECYVDRQRGAWTAVHDLPLDEFGHDYVRPQENGNRTGVRWVELVGAAGGVRVDDLSGEHLDVTAWPYTQEALDAADHIHELRREDTVTLTVGRQRGVGGDLPGLAALLPAYRLPAGRPYRVHVRLTALLAGR